MLGFGYYENPWNAWIWWQVTSQQPKKQILTLALENLKQSVVKHSMQNISLLYFVNLFKILCPWLYSVNEKILVYWGQNDCHVLIKYILCEELRMNCFAKIVKEEKALTIFVKKLRHRQWKDYKYT